MKKIGEVSLKLSFLLFILSLPAFAQVVEDVETPGVKQELSEVTKSKLILELKALNKLPADKVESELQKFNNQVLYYVQQRDKECKGEFSSIELNEQGESEIIKRKLSQSERKLCLLELVNFRKNYLNEVFKIRKKIMIGYHNQQLKDLEQTRKESIKKMEEFAKKLSE